ncbi:MAG: alginate lyase family protein, partial [Planctomycetota bacterium]|nr:alginate lyase family protein [Planctomycetota bacterium]
VCLAVVLTITVFIANAHAADELRSLSPNQVLDKLDLARPGLEKVRQAQRQGDRPAALWALLEYYREKYPLSKAEQKLSKKQRKKADDVCRHIFQWGPYEPADYGKDVDWEWDPRADIEWVAVMYRFGWSRPLSSAYRSTGDEKYAKAFVELTSDWIAKHPLEKRQKIHPVYKSWRGFAWLDIQTGVRAESICLAFPTLVHGKSFTPEFLAVLLASMYDHQRKTELLPMGVVHNKAVFEQRGFVQVCATFPEFRDSRRWMEMAIKRTRDNFLAQTTTDGVQREWSFGYHIGVLDDAVYILEQARAQDLDIPDDYLQRIRKMYDYIFAIATPKLSAPMFGDASRSISTSRDRRRWSLYSRLVEATRLLDDPKYAARAKLDRSHLPQHKSHAFPQAGIYVMRDDWGPEQIYFALHCAPPAISSHDQQDNGTFELCAFGRWLMPDTGFYTYGHDPKGRAWHRQTRVHQTLTLDGKDTKVAARHLLWKTSPQVDVLAVENRSYDDLTHRRTVWFVDKKFFVLLDEAVGSVKEAVGGAKGNLDLHFQLAPGDAEINTAEHWAASGFDDANVLVWQDPAAPVSMHEEQGWYAWKYGHRKPRKGFRYRHTGAAPATFLTVIHPYRGTDQPRVSAKLSSPFKPGADRVEIDVRSGEKTWRIGRDLNSGEAWSNK